MKPIRKNISVLSLSLFIILCTILSVIGGDFAFIVSGTIYCLALIFISRRLLKPHKNGFLTLTSLFLFVYSIIAVWAHYVFITNPFTDSYTNIDETTFFIVAKNLGQLSYSNIWHTAFTKFDYSGYPLFAAWEGTLHKATYSLSPFYSLLFQKLNIAFVGSIVPGVVYLLCCRVVSEFRAYKGAIVYGLLTFGLFYSIGLMRDIHIALIYAIGLYIITGSNYNLKNYIALMILATLSYFIRVENGLFFVVFLGVWMLKSNTRYKVPVYLVSIIVLALSIYLIGGLDVIIGTARNTSEHYMDRAINQAGQNSLGILLNKFPFPFNYFSKSIYGQISPFPFWVVFEGGEKTSLTFFQSLFYLPEAVAGLFWFLVWTRIVVRFKKSKQFFKEYKWLVLLTLIYIIAVSSGQAMPRRLMAIYPLIFMGYLFIDPKTFRRKEVIGALSLYGILIIIYLVLKL